MSNEDQEPRGNTGMVDSNGMTIEYLRVRLLSERSVSKAARQRADELAKRVTELEDQLKFISLQRKKAEKATVDVLAILESNGISDVSEGFDSSSDPDETPHAHNGSKETLTNDNSKKKEIKPDSSSDFESSPSTGRSLSWKSSKDPTYSLERKINIDTVRRRYNYASSGSSARKLGKSCRRIRRRETRSTEELQNDSSEKTTCSRNVSNCYDGETDEIKESARYDTGKPLRDSTLDSDNGSQNTGVNFRGHERDEDIETALENQARLIGQYEEEEKAQREWEEKFRENYNASLDSGDPGIHSDVTEERFEIKSTEMLHAAMTSSTEFRETKQERLEPKISKTMPSFHSPTNGSLQAEKCNSRTIKESPNRDSSREFLEISPERFQEHLSTHNTTYIALTRPLYGSVGSPSLKLAAVPEETPNNLGSILDALQQAKLSLHQKLRTSHTMGGGGTSSNPPRPLRDETSYADHLNIPVVPRGLFRLPTDNQIDAKMRAGFRSMGVRHTSDHYSPESSSNKFNSKSLAHSGQTLSSDMLFTAPQALPTAGVRSAFLPESSSNKFDSESVAQSRRTFSSDMFLTAPQGLATTGIRSAFPPQRSFSQPRMHVSPSLNKVNALDPYEKVVIPSENYSYPFLPDITLRIPLSEEASRTIPVSQTGIPTVTRLFSYNDPGRGPEMYR